MPVIHIRSLPYEAPLDVPCALTGLTRDFAKANDLPLTYVHAIWRFLQPGHYGKGAEAPDSQPEAPHNVLVELLAPGFNGEGSRRTDADVPCRQPLTKGQNSNSEDFCQLSGGAFWGCFS